MYIATNAELDLLIPIVVATFAGSLIGVERELRHKAAGIGTNMLICSGACIFVLLSARVDVNSPSRIAANILTGVGFIGAGLIIKESTTNTIRGLTTAAGIWMAASLGMAFGFGFYLVGAFGTVIAIWAPRIPRWIYYRRAKTIIKRALDEEPPHVRQRTKQQQKKTPTAHSQLPKIE